MIGAPHGKAVLTCSASGKPTPTVVWKIEDTEIPDEEVRLEITVVVKQVQFSRAVVQSCNLSKQVEQWYLSFISGCFAL